MSQSLCTVYIVTVYILTLGGHLCLFIRPRPYRTPLCCHIENAYTASIASLTSKNSLDVLFTTTKRVCTPSNTIQAPKSKGDEL